MNTVVRQLTLAEVVELLLWAKAEGWNPGVDDAGPFHAADPAAFLGCFVEGRLASAISAVRSGPDFGFIGLYICHPEFRGKGLGRRIWETGIARLGGRTIGLDGVPAQQENYRAMGFVPAYRTWRYCGRFMPDGIDPSVTPIGHAMLPSIVVVDRRHYPGPRADFLGAWIAAPRIARAVARAGRVTGYGVLRKCHDGCKIGPLFAETDVDAHRIFLALCAASEGETISIDVPETAEGFSSYLADIAFEKGFDTMRMYRGPSPRNEMRGIFGVTTLELG